MCENVQHFLYLLRNLEFEINFICSGSRNLDNINVDIFHDISTPMDRGTKERDTGSNVLHQLECWDLPIFKDIAFCPHDEAQHQ